MFLSPAILWLQSSAACCIAGCCTLTCGIQVLGCALIFWGVLCCWFTAGRLSCLCSHATWYQAYPWRLPSWVLPEGQQTPKGATTNRTGEEAPRRFSNCFVWKFLYWNHGEVSPSLGLNLPLWIFVFVGALAKEIILESHKAKGYGDFLARNSNKDFNFEDRVCMSHRAGFHPQSNITQHNPNPT